MIKKIKINDIEYIGLFVLMASFFFPIKINSLVIIVLVVINSVKFVKRSHNFTSYKALIFFPLLFLILAFGLVYTENIFEGKSILERHLSLIIAPVIAASVLSLNQNKKDNLFLGLLVTAVIVGAYLLGYAFFDYYKTGLVYVEFKKEHFIYNKFMHHRLSSPLQIHAIYLSFYFSFINVISFSKLLFNAHKMTNLIKWCYIISFLFLSVLIFLLKSSNFAFIFPLGCLILIVLRYRKLISSTIKAKVLLVIFLLCAFVFMFFGVKSKLENVSFSYTLSDPNPTALSTRLSIWECSLEVVKENWLWGTGTGDCHDEVVNKYSEKGFDIGANEYYNTHNMFLQYWVSNGIFSVVLFLFILLYLLHHAYKKRNPIYFIFILFFFSFSLTESTMFIQKGIVFFVFLSSMFFWSPQLWNFTNRVK